jgi:transcriptional regulator with XRE-family HTH domain
MNFENTDIDVIYVCKFVKLFRKEYRMKLIQLAKRTGIDRKILSAIEKGEHPITLVELELICREFNSSTDHALDRAAHIKAYYNDPHKRTR